MRTIETTVFTFEELSETAKERAIQELYDINVDGEWWDAVYEDANNVGIRIQAFDIDRGSYCEATINDHEETAHKIIDNHGDTCETYKTAERFLAERDKLIDEAEKDDDGEFVDEYKLDNALNELTADFHKEIEEDYRIMLQKEYEYLTSEESIKETIIANEYEFIEDGKLF